MGGEFRGGAGLADTGFAGEQDQAAVARAGGVERGAQSFEFVVAPDEDLGRHALSPSWRRVTRQLHTLIAQGRENA